MAPSWRAQPTTVEVTSTLDPQHHEFIAGFHTIQMANDVAARERRAARRSYHDERAPETDEGNFAQPRTGPQADIDGVVTYDGDDLHCSNCIE